MLFNTLDLWTVFLQLIILIDQIINGDWLSVSETIKNETMLSYGKKIDSFEYERITTLDEMLCSNSGLTSLSWQVYKASRTRKHPKLLQLLFQQQ